MPSHYDEGSISDRDVLYVYLRDIAEKSKRIRNRGGNHALLFGDKFRKNAGIYSGRFSGKRGIS